MRVREEETEGDNGREADKKGEKKGPTGFYPSQVKSEREKAEKAAVNAARPGDRLMVARL